MSKLNINRLTNENEDGAPKITGITTFSSTAFLNPPKGNTAQRPEYVQPGMIRFNTDSGHLEYYNGVEWTEVLVANNTLDGGARGLNGGGWITTPNTATNTIDYVTISTIGNAIDFGDLITARRLMGSCSSSTRGIWGGGYSFYVNTIDYVSISSSGNAQDFGDLNSPNGPFGLSSSSSSTRGLFFQGYNGNNLNTIDYVTISSIGNAVDFGDVTGGSKYYGASCSSSTRALIAGGYSTPAFVQQNTIDYVTISTTGNSIDFGDLLSPTISICGVSNSSRGVFAGGTNVIQYVTIASIGNAIDFGDLSSSISFPSGCSSSTRGVFFGGESPTFINSIEYITILTTGNSIDFGDMSVAKSQSAACSNGHGGL
jgi:hypothetical protein